MLEGCRTLEECESLIRKVARSVTLLGDIGLSEGDVGRLTELIRSFVSGDVNRAVNELPRLAPCSLSCFLVWQGILSYREGEFWGPVAQAVCLPHQRRWQQRWGMLFLECLRALGLPTFSEAGGHRFVGPILMHGGIPDSCLVEYFDAVVARFCRDGIVEAPSVDLELKLLRSEEIQLRELVARKERLARQLRDIQLYVRYSRELSQLESSIRLKAPSCDLLGFSQADYLRALEELAALRSEVEELKRARSRTQEEVLRFTERDRQLLARAVEIESIRQEMRLLVQELTSREAEIHRTKETLEALLREWSGSPNVVLDPEGLHRLSFNELKRTAELHDGLYARAAQERIRAGSCRRKFLISAFPAIFSGVVGAYLVATTPHAGGAFLAVGILAGLVAVRQLLVWLNVSRSAEQIKADLTRVRRGMLENLARVGLTGEAVTQQAGDLVDGLKHVAQAWDQYQCRLREYEARVDRLEEVEHTLRAIVRSALTVKEQAAVADELDQLVREARSREMAANRAAEEIRNRLQPALDRCQRRVTELEHQVAAMRTQLAQLGEGNPDLGWERLGETLAARKHLAQLRAMVAWLRRRIGRKAAEPEVIAARLREELKAIDNRICLCPPYFRQVSEPVQRFLVFGGETAARYLKDSIACMHALMQGSEPPLVDCHPLVRRAFCRWRESVPRTKVEPPAKYFSRPSLRFDPLAREVRMRLPAQRVGAELLQDSAQVEVELSGGNGEPVRETARLYRRAADLVETEHVDMVVPWPAPQYRVTLLAGCRPVLQWDVPGLARDFLVFDYRRGHRIEGELPRGLVWVLMPSSWRVADEGLIIEEGPYLWNLVPARWALVAVDLTRLRQGSLRLKGPGVEEALPVVPAVQLPEPSLEGRLAPFLVEGEEAYVGEAPTLCLDESERPFLSLWRLSLWRRDDLEAGAAGAWRICLLRDVAADVESPGDTAVRIPLARTDLIPPGSVGRFVLRLRGRGREFTFAFAVLPEMIVEWDRAVYPPWEASIGEEVFATLRVLTRDESTLELEPPAQLCESNGAYGVWRIPLSAASVAGVARVLTGPTMRISVIVPKVMLRWQPDVSGGWTDQVIKAWIGDWDSGDPILSIRLPVSATGRAIVKLAEPEQRRSVAIRQGLARIDLSEFRDSLWQAGPEPILVLSIRDEVCLEDVPVLRVARDSITELRTSYRVSTECASVSFQWRERRQAPARLVRIWSIDRPWCPPLICSAAEGERSLTIEQPVSVLPPGPYVLSFSADDPWASTPGQGRHWPRKGDHDVHEVWLQPDCPCVKEIGAGWTRSCEGDLLRIAGQVDAVARDLPEKLHVAAVGVDCGKARGVWSTATVKADGRFTAEFRAGMHWARWVGVVSCQDASPFGVWGVVPGRTAVVALDREVAGAVKDLAAIMPLYVTVVPLGETRVIQPVLKPGVSAKLIDAVAAGTGRCQVLMDFETGPRRVEIEFGGSASASLVLDDGVECLVCHALAPDQRTWHDLHYGKCGAPGTRYACRVRQRRTDAMLYVGWNYDDFLSWATENLPGWLSFRSGLAVVARWAHSSSGLQTLTRSALGKQGSDLEELVGLLGAAELSLIRQMLEGMRYAR